jgi:hypothetical protein
MPAAWAWVALSVATVLVVVTGSELQPAIKAAVTKLKLSFLKDIGVPFIIVGFSWY